jgi:hypothetical protein
MRPKLFLFLLLLAPLARAQALASANVQPGITTPECMVEHDPDRLGFGPCDLLRPRFGADYLSRHDIIIQYPKGYKRAPLGKTFWLLEAGAIGMGILDEERTQHLLHEKLSCNAAGQCFQYREADPILGSTRVQAYSVLGAIDVADLWIGYKMQKYDSDRQRLVGVPWRRGFSAWLYNYRVPLVVQIVVHGVAVIRTAHVVL